MIRANSTPKAFKPKPNSLNPHDIFLQALHYDGKTISYYKVFHKDKYILVNL